MIALNDFLKEDCTKRNPFGKWNFIVAATKDVEGQISELIFINALRLQQIETRFLLTT